MDRYLLQFMLVMVAFSGGGLLVNAWVNELLSKKIEIVPPVKIEEEIKEETSKLTFDCACDAVEEAQTSDGVRGSRCLASDGSQVIFGNFEDKDKSSANRTFEREVKGALKVVSIAPIFDDQGVKIGKRALIQNESTVKIIKLLNRTFDVSFIEAPDLKHALTYEKHSLASEKHWREIFGNIRTVD